MPLMLIHVVRFITVVRCVDTVKKKDQARVQIYLYHTKIIDQCRKRRIDAWGLTIISFSIFPTSLVSGSIDIAFFFLFCF